MVLHNHHTKNGDGSNLMYMGLHVPTTAASTIQEMQVWSMPCWHTAAQHHAVAVIGSCSHSVAV